MATILAFLQGRENVFDPKDVTAMSMALDDVCKALNLRDDSAAREVIAVRIADGAPEGKADHYWHLARELINRGEYGSACSHAMTPCVCRTVS